MFRSGAACRVVESVATLSDIRQGWQLLEICGRAVSNREDVLSPAWKNGRVWLKQGATRS